MQEHTKLVLSPIQHLSGRLSLLWGLTVFVAACSGSSVFPTDFSIALASEFQPFYLVHGGERTLGPPISAAFQVSGLTQQCFVGGCLEYHPQLDPDRRVILSALPAEIRYRPSPSQEGGTMDDGLYFPETGHSVSGAFHHFFDSYGGVHFFGYPVSQVEVRSESQLVQYFERAILVWDINLPPGDAIQLAPVGSLSFESYSTNNMHSFLQEWEPGVTSTTETVQAIVDFAQAHGGRHVFGSPVGDPHLADDGVMEQVYTNAVVVEDSGAPNGVSLRPLGRLAYGGVGRAVAAADDPESVYYSATGHNVLAAFKTFYNAYGGEHLFGLPISEAFVHDGSLVQYFENVEMAWHPRGDHSLGVSLHELGIQYASSAWSAPEVNMAAASKADSSSGLDIHSWVRFPFVLPGDNQEINVLVTDGRGQPVSDALVKVDLYTLHGMANFVLAPTGADGRSSLLIPASEGQGIDGYLVTYRTVVRVGDTVTVLTDNFQVLTWDDS